MGSVTPVGTGLPPSVLGSMAGGGNSHSCFTAENVAKPGLLFFPRDETESFPLGTNTCGAFTSPGSKRGWLRHPR